MLTADEYFRKQEKKRNRAGTIAVWFFMVFIFMLGFIVGHVVQIVHK